MATYVQMEDEGILLSLTVYQADGVTPYDLSTIDVNTQEMRLGPPNGDAAIVGTNPLASLPGGGLDGVITYQVQPGDLYMEGTWYLQAYWEEGGNARRSTVATFDVYSNVE